MEFLLQTLCFGVLTSVIATLLLIWLQYRNSTAGYRVEMIRKATMEITDDKKIAIRSMLRDKYRYSLGVIIDDLNQCFEQGFPANGPWPALVDNGAKCHPTAEDKLGDRWEKFNYRIRPVIQDINTYAFIGILQLTPALRSLHALTKLCIELENVVGELDAAFENHLVCLENNRVVVCSPEHPELESLRDAYYKLYLVWIRWSGQSAEDNEFWQAHSIEKQTI